MRAFVTNTRAGELAIITVPPLPVNALRLGVPEGIAAGVTRTRRQVES